MYSPPGPDYPAAMGLLQHLSADELKELLNDDKKLEDLIRDLQQVKNLQTEKEMTLASNKSVAEFNLSQEPKLAEEKEKLLEMYGKTSEVLSSMEEKKSQLDTITDKISLDTALALLQTATAESEEETEALADKFFDGKMDVEEFIEEFQKKRTVMHLRRLKTDKMKELLAQPQQVPVPQAQRNSHWSASGPAPYPTQPVGMPMPGYR